MRKGILAVLVLFLVIGGLFQWFNNKEKNACANSISCINNLSTVIENDTQGVFLGNLVTVPNINLTSEKPVSVVLGAQDTTQPKHIYIDLSAQKLYAYQGTDLYLETLVSTGKWGRTPAGEYRIWVKIRSTRMAGGSGNDAYNLPNVPYVMFFYGDQLSKGRGFGLHGTYWHNNFGHEMSHGCVNLRNIDAKALYDWTNPVTQSSTTYESADDPGTPISICHQIQLKEESTPLCLE